MGKTVDCNFVSVWGGGLEVIRAASFDPETGEVSGVSIWPHSASKPEVCRRLEREYIVVNGRTYDVARDEDGRIYALRTFEVFFSRNGYARVTATNAHEAFQIADLQFTSDDVSWDDDWHPTDVQPEDDLHDQ